MKNTIDYTCVDNDNEIQVVIDKGRISEFWFKEKYLGATVCISIDDLEAAIQEAKDEISELDRIEMKMY